MAMMTLRLPDSFIRPALWKLQPTQVACNMRNSAQGQIAHSQWSARYHFPPPLASDHLVKLCQTVSGNHSIQCSRLNPVSRPPVVSCHLLNWNSHNHLQLHQSLHQSPVSLHPVDLAARIGHFRHFQELIKGKGLCK